MAIKTGPRTRKAPKRVKRADAKTTTRQRARGESEMRRQQQRADAKRLTRQTLLDAGLDEIIDHGLDVGLDAICARAGYTRGAFYVHFKNREEFLLAITGNVLHAIVDAIISEDAEAEGGVASSVGRFAHALEAGVWPLVPKIRIATVRMVDAIDRWSAIRATFDRFLAVAIERLTHIAAREQTAGHVRHDIGARDLATMLVTMGIGTIMLTNTGIPVGRLPALLLALIRPPETAAKG